MEDKEIIDEKVNSDESVISDSSNDESINRQRKKEKSLGLNSFFYLLYTVLNLVFPLITGIYVARVLLPSDIGQIETARNLAQYFLILSFLGIPTYGLREISKYRNDKKELSKIYSELRIINNFSTLIFLFLYICLILIVPVYRENVNIFLIIGILILLNLLNNSWLYEGLEEFGYISIRNLVFKIISFVMLIIFVRNENDYYIYALILTLGTAGNYFLNIIHARKYVKFTFKDLNIKRHIKSILFLVVVNLAIEIYMLVDVTMLGFMCDKETVAYYSYGMKIYKILLQILNTFTVVLVPRIALYYKEKKINEMNEMITRTFIIIYMISLPIIVGVYFTSDYLVPLVYGEGYIRSASVLKILCIICSISPIGYLLGSRMLLITGNESKMIIAVGSGAIVNLVLNIILIHFFSEKGAAIASLISEIVVMIVYVYLGRKYYKLQNCLMSLLKIIVATLFMFSYCIFLSYSIKNLMLRTILEIIGSIFIYFIVLIILKEKTIINFVKSVFRKVFKNV